MNKKIPDRRNNHERLIPIISFKLGHVSIFLKDVPYRLSSCFVYTIAQFSRILRFSLIYCYLFKDLGLWCLTPLSTIFQLRYVVAISFIGWGNRSTTRKPPIYDWQTLSHNVVSSTNSNFHVSTLYIYKLSTRQETPKHLKSYTYSLRLHLMRLIPIISFKLGHASIAERCSVNHLRIFQRQFLIYASVNHRRIL
jgi:hypothetical protein